MRIATLGNAAVVHTQRWVQHFRSRGHEVEVWSLECGPPGLDAHPLPRFPVPAFAQYPLALPALRRSLAAFDPDLLDAHYVPNYGLLGALSGRRPLVVTAWGSDLLVSARDPLRAVRARFVLGRADAVLADSANLADAARRLGAAGERVHTIPWGVDLARFRPGVRREAGLLLSTRMHEPIYDIPTVFRGAKPVLESRPHTRLVIAGHGRLTGTLERLAARLLPEGRYAFLGRLAVEDLAGWVGRADIYLSASLSDSTSLSLLEAMAGGAVPVVSDLDGNREWVGEGDGGRLFRPGDAESLTRAIERALEDPGWADAARARNRRVVVERGDWSVNMGKVETLFAAFADRAKTDSLRTRTRGGRPG